MYASQCYSTTTQPQQVIPVARLAAPNLHTGTYLPRLHAANNLSLTTSRNQTSLHFTSTCSYAQVHQGCIVAQSSKQTNSLLASSVLVDEFRLRHLCSHPWVAEGLLGTR